MNIMNVDVLSEIMVTVGRERCTIDLGTTTDTVRNIARSGAQTYSTYMSLQVLSCQPPQSLSTSSKKRQSSSSGKVCILSSCFISVAVYTLGLCETLCLVVFNGCPQMNRTSFSH